MSAMNDDLCCEWSRYQWAGVYPIPDEDEPLRWSADEWVGDLGDSARHESVAVFCPWETAGGFSGFGCRGSVARWVPSH